MHGNKKEIMDHPRKRLLCKNIEQSFLARRFMKETRGDENSYEQESNNVHAKS
jgi:hypothetical protein